MRPYLSILGFLVSAVFCTEAQQTKTMVGKANLTAADSLLALSDWKGAALLYESVLKEEPGSPLAWSNLGFCHHNLGNYTKAIECYSNAVGLTKDPLVEIPLQIRLARTYSRMKQYDNALGCLNKALGLGYRKVGELEREADFDGFRQDLRFNEAVNQARENAFPCMKQKQLREFDFWIGDWTAFVTGTNNIAGYSRIDMASGGCMILENWTSAGLVPFTGKSINFVDASSGKWKQIWVGSGAPNISEFLNGSYRDGAMRFEFEQDIQNGKKQSVRFIFYNEGPDQVRQHHMTSSDGGKTWNTTYDFTYKRKKE
jgi:tetratricopeptide (TPR) repeat protein